MTDKEYSQIVEKVAETLVSAGSTFSADKFKVYKDYLAKEDNALCSWAMEEIVENAEVAKKTRRPLCDDTGIPHLILEVGKNRTVEGKMIDAIYEGVRKGLTDLPGRPMAIKGNDKERIDQSGGLDERSEALLPAPLMLRYCDETDRLRLTVMMQGGGPEIRAKTYRVFHKHDINVVLEEIISWAKESVRLLGCSPCTVAVGIGRSHYEASSLMLQAMADGNYDVQSEYEKKITDALNESDVGALGLGGNCSVLATFMRVGPQRASGVRIVSMRPCCCFEPRKASVDL